MRLQKLRPWFIHSRHHSSSTAFTPSTIPISFRCMAVVKEMQPGTDVGTTVAVRPAFKSGLPQAARLGNRSKHLSWFVAQKHITCKTIPSHLFSFPSALRLLRSLLSSPLRPSFPLFFPAFFFFCNLMSPSSEITIFDDTIYYISFTWLKCNISPDLALRFCSWCSTTLALTNAFHFCVAFFSFFLQDSEESETHRHAREGFTRWAQLEDVSHALSSVASRGQPHMLFCLIKFRQNHDPKTRQHFQHFFIRPFTCRQRAHG